MSTILNGKTAIVTGGGRGIGRAVAFLLAREGAKVAIVDNGSETDGSGSDASVADRVAREIGSAGGSAMADHGDVSEWKSAERLVESVVERWGKLDILVNAAGNIRLCTIADVAEKDFDDVLRVHLRGTFNTTHFAAKHWVKRKEAGRLINFASGVALRSFNPSLLSYATAKAGIVGFTIACANALIAYGVTANVVSPSADTRMVEITTSKGRGTLDTQSRDNQARDFRDPAHVAPMVVFLASEQAKHITGRVFGATAGRYTLWSLPQEEREVRMTWPQDYAHMCNEFDRELGRGLKPEDLPTPMASLEGNWRHYGSGQPRWDFRTRPRNDAEDVVRRRGD